MSGNQPKVSNLREGELSASGPFTAGSGTCCTATGICVSKCICPVCPFLRTSVKQEN